MKYGVFIFATDLAMDPVSLAVAAEERGFESLFVPEHVHMPVDPRDEVPAFRGRIAAGRVSADSRPIRGVGGSGGRDIRDQAGHRHLPGHRA